MHKITVNYISGARLRVASGWLGGHGLVWWTGGRPFCSFERPWYGALIARKLLDTVVTGLRRVERLVGKQEEGGVSFCASTKHV